MLYFDHNATTPCRPEVLERVAAAAREYFGNPSSLHAAGRAARAVLEESRETLARHLGGAALEYVFTSGGTEANRLAIDGVLRHTALSGIGSCHGVISAIEHPSVLELYARLEEDGLLEVTRVAPRPDGRVDAGAFTAALRPSTIVASLQHSNNETGVIQDIAPVARACREAGVALHVDAVQSIGKVELAVERLGADLVSLASHKIGGPKGAGALWVRRGARFAAPWPGGPQEQQRRPGTESLPAIVGLAEAVSRLDIESATALRAGEVLWERLAARLAGVHRNGDPTNLLPNTLNVSFDGVAAEELLIRLDLDGVAASSGAACASGSREPSHVLRAMGLPQERVRGAVRLSSGWSTRPEEIDTLVDVVVRAVEDLRERRAAG